MERSHAGTYGPVVLEGVRLAHTFRQVGDLKLHCVEAGPENGPLALLLHGFPEGWLAWRHQIAPLARSGLRVVAPDQRGYGTSEKPAGVNSYLLELLASDMAALADTLGRRRFQLVGHDWGGVVAWRLAADLPDRVERLAILNAPHPAVWGRHLLRSPTQFLRSAYIGFFQLPWLPEAVLSARNFTVLAAMMRRASRPGTFSEGDLAIYRQAWAQQQALSAMLNWYRALPWGRQCREAVQVPALVLWGARDIALERRLAQDSLSLCETGRVQWFENAGHWVQHEEAMKVSIALADFLLR
jgi:epoxide hydrolase 4